MDLFSNWFFLGYKLVFVPHLKDQKLEGQYLISF